MMRQKRSRYRDILPTAKAVATGTAASPLCIEQVIQPWLCRQRQPKQSLQESYPQVAACWHRQKNCGWSPRHFTSGSSVAAWWRCPVNPNHAYQQAICLRVSSESSANTRHGCPFCSNHVPCQDNCLANHPDIAREWMSAKNGRTPKEVVAASRKKGWWKCRDCHHEWKATPYHRAIKGTGCRACNHGLPIDLRDYPLAMKQFHWKKNKGINPYALNDHQRIWWKCSKSKDHRWKASFRRTQGERCPFCKGSRASATNNLTLKKRLCREFHPTRNGNLRPEEISLTSQRRVWWKCKKGPDHEWKAPVRNRVKGTACPFCLNRKVSKINCLATVAPKVAAEWHHDQGHDLTPDKVLPSSRRIVMWLCPKGHDYEMSIRSRVEQGSSCPRCRVNKNSLARSRPDISEQWHPTKNGAMTPEDVTVRSPFLAWWRCKKVARHQWQATVHDRTAAKNAPCPGCRRQRSR